MPSTSERRLATDWLRESILYREVFRKGLNAIYIESESQCFESHNRFLECSSHRSKCRKLIGPQTPKGLRISIHLDK